MLDIQLTDEQEEVRAVAGRLSAEVLEPAAREVEEARAIPNTVIDRITATGLHQIPDALTAVVAAEALGRGDAVIAIAALTTGAADVLLSAVQPAHGVPDGAATVALYEGYGRAPLEWLSTISPTSGGRWRVTADKLAVPMAATTESIVVVGRDPDADHLRAVVVAVADEGVDVAAASGHLAFDAVPLHRVRVEAGVGDRALVGGPTLDPAVLERFVSRVRLQPAAAALGCAARAVEYAAVYASERVAFGQPLSAFQGISFLLAEAAVAIEAGRLDLWAVAAELDAAADGQGPGLDDMQVSRTVGYVCSTAAAVTRDALQVLGGHGFIRDHPIERWYRTTAMISTFDFDPTIAPFAPVL